MDQTCSHVSHYSLNFFSPAWRWWLRCEDCLVLINLVRPHQQIMSLWRAKWLASPQGPMNIRVSRSSITVILNLHWPCIHRDVVLWWSMIWDVGDNQGSTKDSVQDWSVLEIPCTAHSFLSMRHCYGTYNTQQRNRRKSWSTKALKTSFATWIGFYLAKENGNKSQESVLNANITLVALDNFIQWQNEKEPP